jgi:hypothetical protein
MPSARPYIGEVSIIRPPASTSACTTARKRPRAGSSAPTSNTCQVPSPTTGIGSPEDGIGRVIIGEAAMVFNLVKSGIAAAPAPSRTRRERPILVVIASAAKQSRAAGVMLVEIASSPRSSQ